MILSRKNNKGFTLIELLVVVAIIGVLSSVVLVSINSARISARDTRRISDMKNISTALELFYSAYGRYPITAGASYWDGHWMNFQTCLETGVGCGFTISGIYEPVMKDVPNDPKDVTPNVSDNSVTYYFSYNCTNNQGYLLKARLEKNHNILQSDADGGAFSAVDLGCADTYNYYCIKQNWCY
ncbi:MAG: hypothetical protein UU10_C0050G0011 [Parcubacteria group bacterium GW2011_GWF1_40_6]|uniref:General secretion pathway protein G n=2 Tax=Candidatus Nomuraibacteriota TaxID=1752729 RepID=A0A0G0R0G8_9BACT|nr:MAG: hypothetical protein UT78_C0007G0054 [Candidatus Nomurabacteria bacterium GW2011_GWF2_40_12]KKR67248.1 MAG: hypothetical protein UU10_C0050G0011 [Parcubacteria group bacterium GW2011_GWF1_40_6]OGJ08782.1 MAG: hypothetical protein A2356_02385 [Candidatus Nomurabacteria bacterium RIFOXYB1_FULL_39_16]OGJ15400.1 MAG: hypothetical protein A2585_02690 [Candidatus Nomurabacteria bacterium RIFOXYD1_FULL_39_12]